MQDAPRVFISYSHDDQRHQQRVLDLANRLRHDGIDAEIDQYEPAPPEGWPLWCERQIKKSDHVLLMCTETYLRRVNAEEARSIGRGVLWEARIIRHLLYESGFASDKVVPVLFSDGSADYVPTPLRGATRYLVDTDAGYENLLRRLTKQPGVKMPALGKRKILPAKQPRPEAAAAALSGSRGVTDRCDVFLSYSRNDLEAAASLRAQFARSGLSVFKDDDSIRAGEFWLDRLKAAVDACRSFVVLVGRDGVRRWSGAETQMALNRYFGPHDDAERLPIFPILLDGTAPESLPAFLQLFRATPWNGAEPIPERLLDDIRDRNIIANIQPVFEGCPFVGLAAYRPDQAHLFFGRQKETLDALACFETGRGSPTVRWLEINGNSGSGKSSLMNAGLLPLIDQGWLWPRTGYAQGIRIGPMMPGERPVEMLAESLARTFKTEMADICLRLSADEGGLSKWLRSRKQDDTAFLLAIDQFEELLTLADPEQRRRFDGLVAAALEDPDCPLLVISTVNADFLDRFEDLPRLVAARNQLARMWTLAPIDADGLREVIEGPGQLADLDVSEVKEAIVADARDEPGALPLVENALRYLWERRVGHRLSGRMFNEQGGLAGIFSKSGEIDRLIDSYTNQRQQALIARTIQLARAAAAEASLSRLDQMVADLPEGRKGFLGQTARIKVMVGEIAALQRQLDTMNRPAFREPVAGNLTARIETFAHKIAGFPQPLASEFRRAAASWLTIAQLQHDEIKARVARNTTPQVFRAGDPVQRDTEAFVPRMPVIEQLEGQIMLATGCPGLLVGGRRRMGKSTLIRNLVGFIPETVKVLAISMLAARAHTSLAHLCEWIAREVGDAVGLPPIHPSDNPPLVRLFDQLIAADQALAQREQRLLLAIDEFEKIDAKIGEGVFPADLLSTVRESIQSHRRIIWAFVGSHHLAELTHASWPSYFVSVRSITVPPFEPGETRRLLTEPLVESGLWRARGERPPRFDPGFWGDGGIERIHTEAGGWPHLVQLLAETAVELVNNRQLAALDASVLEEATDQAVGRGTVVLSQLIEGECRTPAEWAYLLGFRTGETQPPPADEQVRRSLRRRLLVLEDGERWRLRVPLMRRWLIKQA